MTQTYRSRVAARPAYARLKNTKKNLRRQLRTATTDAEIARIDEAWLDAEEAYRRDPRRTSDEQRDWYAKRDIAAAWRAAAEENAAAAKACGDETCPAATCERCICRCGGANHGAAIPGYEHRP